MTTSAAILVGGHARRFGGRDKSQLVVDGRTILDRQRTALQPLASTIALIGRTTPHPAAPDLPVVPDAVSAPGPLAGLLAALSALRDDHVIVVACDMPGVTAALFRRLLDDALGFDAVVPRTDRAHPTCAVYARSALAVAQAQAAQQQYSLQSLLAALRVRYVDAHALSAIGDVRLLLTNVNTPDDLHDLETTAAHRR